MLKEDKCYYCNKLAIVTKKIVVDVESDHDVDPETGEVVWFSHPIYSVVGVCEEHGQDDGESIDERIGEE